MAKVTNWLKKGKGVKLTKKGRGKGGKPKTASGGE